LYYAPAENAVAGYCLNAGRRYLVPKISVSRHFYRDFFASDFANGCTTFADAGYDAVGSIGSYDQVVHGLQVYLDDDVFLRGAGSKSIRLALPEIFDRPALGIQPDST
jgi:hypothetical protein